MAPQIEATLLTAPGDGVSPAVLLTLGAARPRAQYLFSVPEGLARLGLEHRVRPGLGLRAAFAADAGRALAGAGGLLMRLRGEGHGQVHLVGPPGTAAVLLSLRHFIHWQHPAVLLSECSEWEQPGCYEDDQMAVAALWRPQLLGALWPAPAWLLAPKPQQQPKQDSSSSSSSEEDTSSSEENSSSAEASESSSGDEVEGSSPSSSDRDEEVEALKQVRQPKQSHQTQQQQQGQQQGQEQQQAQEAEQQGQQQGQEQQQAQEAEQQGCSRLSVFDDLDALFAQQPRGRGNARRQVLARLASASAAAPGKLPGRPAAPARQVAPRLPPPKPAAAPPAEAPGVAVVGSRQYHRAAEGQGINVWLHQKLGSAAGGKAHVGGAARAPPPPQQQQQQQREVLGWLLHIKSSDQLLLLTNLHSGAAVGQLLAHPALPLLAQQAGRAAGAIHVAEPGLARGRGFGRLLQQLPGPQLLLEHPGPHNQALGHLAAARTAARLSLVSRRLFPLPTAVTTSRGGGAQQPAAAAGDGDGQLAAAAPAGPAAEAGEGDAAGNAPADSVAAAMVEACTPAQAAGSDDGAAVEQSGLGNPVLRAAVISGKVLPLGVAAIGSKGSSRVLLHRVQHITFATWQRQQQQLLGGGAAAAAPEAPVPAVQLTLTPAEPFAEAFDAAAVQAQVQTEHPELEPLLQQLREEHPQLAELLAAAPPPCRCIRNSVPQQPQPPPMPGAARGPAVPLAGLPSLPATEQQQPRVMRPLYAPQALPLQQPAQGPSWQQQHQLQGPVLPLQLLHPQLFWPAPGAPLQQPPAPPPPQQQQGPTMQPAKKRQQEEQEEEGAAGSNKRAAAGLKARLQERQQQQQEGDGLEQGQADGAGPHDPAEQQQLQQSPQQQAEAPGEQDGQGQQQEQPEPEQQPEALPQWLEGAPACVRAAALADAAAAGSGGQASGGSGGSASAAELVFLGTGSAEPSKHRAASAIELRLGGCGRGLLLDCGEGSLGQMVRAHGWRGMQRRLGSMGCVWVSHRHADHMSGVLLLMLAYPSGLRPLLLVGPTSLQRWLAEAAAPLRLRYRYAHCQDLNLPGHWARQELEQQLGFTHVQSVPVRHCSDAWGIVLRHREGWSLVYSGDTQPCQQLAQAGQGATLLLHEATFEPALADQALRKRHSTTGGALGIAQRMGAYCTVLTHISQRYPRLPEGLPPAGGPAPAFAAFDGMRLPLALLPALPALLPAVRAALGGGEGEGDLEDDPGDSAGTTVH